MAIDTTPSTVATNALQAIPFGALIGGPLDACIQAQAVAAKTSWEFIKQVGLTIDPETNETKAISVTFEYNNNGQMTTLVVPLIILLPIPYMAIDTVTIDFMANISAASSSVVETSEDTDLGVAVDATAALKVGPFSLNVTAKANYSAKSHSKAAQDSRYSVEYTMQVHVAGGQADMPAGLQTVLNILQGSVTSVSANDLVTVYPASVPFNKTDTGSVQITLKNNRGVNVEGSKVTIQYDDSQGGKDPFESIEITRGVSQLEMNRLLVDNRFNNSTIRAHRRLYGIPVSGVALKANHKGQLIAEGGRSHRNANTLAAAVDSGTTGVTNGLGQVSFSFKVKPSVMTGTTPITGRFLLTADIPMVDAEGKPIVPATKETQYVSFQIIPDGRLTTLLDTKATNLVFESATKSHDVEITTMSLVDDSAVPSVPVEVSVEISSGIASSKVFDNIKVDGTAGKSSDKAEGISNTTGAIKFTFSTISTSPAVCKGFFVFKSQGAETVKVAFEVNS